MDHQTSGGDTEAFSGSNMFADPQFPSYDNLDFYSTGADPNFNDASWGLNASEYPDQSRVQQQPPAWPQNNASLSAQIGQQGFAQHQSLPYGRVQSQSPASFVQNGYPSYSTSPAYPYREQIFDPAHAPTSASHSYDVDQYNQTEPVSGRPSAPLSLDSDHIQQNLPSSSNTGAPYQAPALAPQLQADVQTRPHEQQSTTGSLQVVDEEALVRAVPSGVEAGLFSIIGFDDIAKATNSERFGNFINISKNRYEWQCNRSALPSYVPRHSRKELRELASKNATILAKIGKKQPKQRHLSAATKPAKSKPESLSSAATTSAPTSGVISSSDEESSDSDDDSTYSDDDGGGPPLPSKKPEDPKALVEYDTIKALWRSARKEVDGASFRVALVDFWEIVKTIRDRWKTDSTALSDAEEKKRVGELPLLKSRVKDQRDMIEVAFRAAFKHGHRGVVELLAENAPLLFVCFQFLLDRHKADDHNGPVTRAILETMSLFTTLTEERLEKTRLNKVIPLYLKKGDAKTQFWVKKIKTNAALATKTAASKRTSESDQKAAPTSTAADRAPSPVPKAVEPITGVKRTASAAGDANPSKKVATGAAKTTSSAPVSKPNGIVKRPATGGTSATAPNAATNIVRKTVPAKTSTFFSSLQSAPKKPGTSITDKPAVTITGKPTAVRPATTAVTPSAKPAFSFADEIAKISKPKEEKPAPKPEKSLSTESPEEQAKRLRKEERRKLRVRFKPDSELEQIRLFTHDPEEEMHHDASQVRDVADVGGEGRMFKQQHQMMDIDEDDDPAEEEENLINFRVPSGVDFSVVDPDERRRNYAPYGGGELQPESPESAERQRYEDKTLVVFYPSPSDIPADPREPTQPYTDSDQTQRSFGSPEEQYLSRARAKRAQRLNGKAGPGFNMAALAGVMGTRPPMQSTTTVAPAIPIVPDIEKILASLRQGPNAAAPPPPQQAFGQPYVSAPQVAPSFPAPQAPAPSAGPLGGIDLAAILAALNKNNAVPPNTVPTSGPAMSGNAASSHGFSYPGANADHSDIDKIKATNPLYKTKACRYWQEGRCHKGDACSYVHEGQ